MFKRLTIAEKNILMREHWAQIRARGKRRFIQREMIAGVLIGAGVVVITELLATLAHPPSRGTIVFVSLVALAIFLLGGYLEGKWRWQDFEKKYSQDILPPWE